MEMRVKKIEEGKDLYVTSSVKVRFNTTITGLPALWIVEWQKLGLVRSKSDVLRQALVALKEKFSALELKPSCENESYE